MSTLWIITGTSTGLGRALAIRAASRNDVVYGISRREGPDLLHYIHIKCDLSSSESLSELQLPDAEGVDRLALVNNAATLGPVQPIGKQDDESIISSYMLNVVAPHVLSNRFLHHYQNSSAEKIIINISSGAANTPYDGWSVYSSSKAAVNMLSSVGAAEATIHSDRVYHFAIAPGVLDTDMQAAIRHTDENDFSHRTKFMDLFEEGRLVDPAVVADKLLDVVDHPDSYRETIFRL